MIQHTKKFFAVMMLVLLMALIGCRQTEVQQVNASEAQEKVAPVIVYQTKQETISQYLKLTGGLEAGDETLVYSETTEKLERIKVKVGEQVKANQVLGIQSSRTFQESVKQAEAALRIAIAQEELARQNHARNEKLQQEQIISQQVFDQTATALKTAALAVEQARATVAQAKEQQGNTVITAPFAGKVAQIFFNVGDMVNMGSPVFKIINTGTFKAKLDVPEAKAANVSLGQTVLASFPAIPDAEFSGTITRIDEAIDQQKRTLEVEVSFVDSKSESGSEQGGQADAERSEQGGQPKPKQAGVVNPAPTPPRGDFSALRSGQFGQFKIETQRHEQAVVIPDNALMTQTTVNINERGEQVSSKTYYVYVVEQDKAVMKVVTPGIYADGRVELTSGVNFGDEVVVTGQNVVKNGDTVAIINQQAHVQ